ncbi:hypothetical protein V1460_35690 [Streptomyces sp. SCSIO 30461]|uniref:hypothetical protein n=1 Tax=Streptomyces sp. SCSIO 30461 TaxID=3118085 RepID=UPI0030D4F194
METRAGEVTDLAEARAIAAETSRIRNVATGRGGHPYRRQRTSVTGERWVPPHFL